MRTPEEFADFFEEELLPRLRAAERRLTQRQALQRQRLRAALPLLWGSAAVLVVQLFVSLPLFVPWAVYAIWRGRKLPAGPKGHFWRPLRQDLVARVVEFCRPGLRYRASGRVTDETLQRSGLYREPYDYVTGEDLVSGRFGDTELRFSEIRMVKVVDRKKHRTETIFRGVHFVADFPKSFGGRVMLLPDRAERTIGRFGRLLQNFPLFAGAELVELEDPDFERHFVCYASDPVEARYLLSTSLIGRLLRFRENTGAKLRVAFVDESIHLAIPLAADFFSMPRELGADERVYRHWMGELGFLTGIVEDLDLNTRIWSKPAPLASAIRRAR